MWPSSRKAWFGTLAALALPLCAHAASWPDVPIPPKTQTTDVARRMIFNGRDMKVRVFHSRQSEQDVLAFYKDAWRKAVVDPFGDQTLVGYMEGDYYVTVQIEAVAGGTKGKIGVVNLRTSDKHFVPGKGIPRPMGSKVFNDISYPDDPIPARTLALKNDLSPRQNARFFRERLEGEGWKPVAASSTCEDGSCVLAFARGEEKLVVVMSPQGEGRSNVVLNIQGE